MSKTKSKIVDNRLSVRVDFDTTLKANSFYETNPYNRAHLATQLLLYDKIIIPTKDFGIIPILISWMGFDSFKNAIDQKVFEFYRYENMIGYGRDGIGLSPFIIQPSDEKEFNWWQTTLFGSLEDALEVQLSYKCSFLSKKERSKLLEKLHNCISPSVITTRNFSKYVIKETIRDINKNPLYKKFINNYSGDEQLNENYSNLKDSGQIPFRILGSNIINDGIDLLLQIAEINLEILISNQVDGADLYLSQGADELISNKIQELNIKKDRINQIFTLFELLNIPDIRPAIQNGELSLSQIYNLRSSKDAKRFRRWFDENDPETGRDLEKLYVSSINKISYTDKFPYKQIKYLVCKGADIIFPGSGLAMERIESYFVKKWINGYTPRLFLDEIRKLATIKK